VVVIGVTLAQENPDVVYPTPVTITATPNLSGGTYVWTFTGNNAPTPGSNDATATFTNVGKYTATVTYTDAQRFR
jgi:hypothetical protein